MELIQLEPSLQHQEKSLEDNISQTRTIQLEIKPFLIDSQLSEQLIQTNTGYGSRAGKTSVQLEQHMPCHLVESEDSELISTHRVTMENCWHPDNENNENVTRLLKDDKLYQPEDETSSEAMVAVDSRGKMSRKQKHTSENGHFCRKPDMKQVRKQDVGILCSKHDSSKIFGEYLTSLQPHATLYSYEDKGLKLTLETIPSYIVLYIIVNKSFFHVLHTDISAMIRMLNSMIDTNIELYFVNILDEVSDYMEVKYNLPRVVRERWVDKRRFFKRNDSKNPNTEKNNDNVQVGNDNTTKVKPEEKETKNDVQVGNDNTMEVKTEAEERNNNVQVGNDNTMEVQPEAKESNTNAQVGNDNTMEVKTEAEERNNNVQVDNDNTMEVQPEAKESNTNAQIDNDNTMEVNTEAEGSNANAQIGNDNTMEVKTAVEGSNTNAQIGNDNTMEVKIEAEGSTPNAQIGNDNTMEVKIEADERNANVQIGNDNTMEVKTEAEGSNPNAQVGNDNTMEVKTEAEGSNPNAQVGNDNTMEVKTEAEGSTPNAQVGNDNTMEVKTEAEGSNPNAQVGNDNTMEVKTEAEGSTPNAQVGNDNTMEVKTEAEESNTKAQVGYDNTMEVKIEAEGSTPNAQIGNDNTMEVKIEAEGSSPNAQIGNDNTMEVQPEAEESNTNAQVGNDNTMEVNTKAGGMNNTVQVGNDNTMEVKTEAEGSSPNAQVGNDNTMEVKTEAEGSNPNAQVGNDNTMEVKTEAEGSNANAQIGNDNTMEVKTEEEERSTNVQVGNDNTMEVKTEAEESNTNAQVGNDNTMEVKTEAEERNTNVQIGNDNTMEVKTEAEERNSNVQVGDNNTMEVQTATDNISCSQIGGDLQYQYRNDSSLEGIILTIKTPEANHKLDVTIKKHIEDNLLHINVELQDLHTQVTSTELGSVIISLKVEEGTKIGAHWMEKVIRTILPEDIMSSLPVGTRMEVTCQASLSLKPLNVDIFETESDVAKSNSLLKEMMHLFSSQADAHRVAAKGSSDLMGELLKSGTEINERDMEGKTPLHKATEAGNVEIVNLLLEEGADVTLKDTKHCTSLHLAAMTGKTKCIEVLMKFGRSEKLEHIEIPKNNCNQPTDYQIVEILLAAGADINARDHDLNTALHSAALTGNFHMVNLLLKYNPDVTCLNKNGYTALHLVVAKRNFESGVQLAEHDQDALHIADKRGNTPLHTTVQGIMSKSVSETISKIPLPGQDTGETPLHLAAKYGHIDSVYILLKLGADVNETNAKGRTVLHEIVRSQITSSENIPGDDLYTAQFIQLYRRNELNTQNEDGNSPVLTAVLGGYWNFANDLVYAGADVNVPNNRGETVLHALARTTKAECPSDLIKTVLAHGGNGNAKDKEGNTPLYLAVGWNNKFIFQKLLDARADPDAKNNVGVSSYDLSDRLGNETLKQLIEKHMQTGESKQGYGRHDASDDNSCSVLARSIPNDKSSSPHSPHEMELQQLQHIQQLTENLHDVYSDRVTATVPLHMITQPDTRVLPTSSKPKQNSDVFEFQ